MSRGKVGGGEGMGFVGGEGSGEQINSILIEEMKIIFSSFGEVMENTSQMMIIILSILQILQRPRLLRYGVKLLN